MADALDLLSSFGFKHQPSDQVLPQFQSFVKA
jgi:hypothetical protein